MSDVVASHEAHSNAGGGFRFRDGVSVFAAALVVRVVVAFFCAGRVPPTADGSFYHVVAQRIANGDGYTWLWPDGVVTYAAHYPIGYPAFLGALYFAFGSSPLVAMLGNAVLGSLGAVVAQALAHSSLDDVDAPLAFERTRRVALAVGFGVAFLPTLVAYTPALMTEGAVATLLGAAALAVLVARRSGGPARTGALLGLAATLALATLVRPQALVFAPVFGFFAADRASSRTGGESLGTSVSVVSSAFGPGVKRALFAVTFTATTVLAVLPWTLRNCEKMERCVFVSANGGWNLLIGTFAEGRGAWVPVDGARVPSECREVFQEAAKDECFGRAGARRIRSAPLAWLGLAPDKLVVTFDHTASAAEHLRAAGTLDERGAWALGATEIVTQRVLFALAAFGVFSQAARARRDRASRSFVPFAAWPLGLRLLFPVVLGGFFVKGAWFSFVVLSLLGLVVARRLSVPLLLALYAVGSTAVVHAVFFGAGRYSLPLLVLLAPAVAGGCAALARRSARGSGTLHEA